jgi:phosphopantothenoylcysteine synthetase/decarboxylase
MYKAASEIHSQMDICVFAAAVADYAPAEIALEKIKKSDAKLTIDLVKNVDIAANLGAKKKQNQIHIGFALETEKEAENAQNKLSKKNLDMIVLNSMKESGAGFQLDTNKVHIFHASGLAVESDVAPKNQIAELIIDQIKNIPVWV